MNEAKRSTVEMPVRYLTALAKIASTDETRIIINSVMMESEAGQLLLVATDGRRLLAVRPELAYDGPRAVIGTDAIAAIASVSDGNVIIEVTPEAIEMHFSENVRVAAPNMERFGAKYPAWRGVVPKKLPDKLEVSELAVNGALLIELIEAVRVFVGSRSEQLYIAGGGIAGSADGSPYVIQWNSECIALFMPLRGELNAPIHKLPEWAV